MLVDGADEAKLTVQMKKELKAMQVRHEKNIGVAQSWVDIAQWELGTLVGLVAMAIWLTKSYWTCDGSCTSYNPLWSNDSQHYFYTYSN